MTERKVQGRFERGCGRWRGSRKENKQCQGDVNGGRDLVLFNLDGSGMMYEIYMKHKIDICISCVKRHV